MSQLVRLAAVGFVPPAHDHRKDGVDLEAVRQVALRVAKDKPDFICFPELCACIGGTSHELAYKRGGVARLCKA